MGLSSTLIYTSELILCSAVCVPSATRHNIQIDIKPIQTIKGRFISKDFIKTGFIKLILYNIMVYMIWCI